MHVKFRQGSWIGIAAALACGLGGAGPSAPLLREQRSVQVASVTETWRLVWAAPPAAVCRPEEIEMAITCPCSGFAYGEAGDLLLERFAAGARPERMRLAPLFADHLDLPMQGKAVLQRWPIRQADHDAAPGVLAEVRSRPSPRIMQFADYNHDGQATEFLLQVGTMPCGKQMFAAIGVSKANPRLHAIGSAAHPETPLVLYRTVWEALAREPRPAPLLIWDCDDHGSEVRSVLTVSADRGAIRAVNRDYGCPSQGDAGRLLKTTEW